MPRGDADRGRRLATEAFDEVIVAAAAENRSRDLACRVETLEDDAGVVIESTRRLERDRTVLACAEVLGGLEDVLEVLDGCRDAVGVGKGFDFLEVAAGDEVAELGGLVG